MIDAWLDDQTLGVMPRSLDAPSPAGSLPRQLELGNCLQPDHIIPEAPAEVMPGPGYSQA